MAAKTRRGAVQADTLQKRAMDEIRRLLMKKSFIIILSLVCIFIFSSCSNNEVAGYAGVNAEIVEMTFEVEGMVVRSLDVNSILGNTCYVNCSIDNISFVHVNNATGEPMPLSFGDFKIGDQISLDIEKVENSYAEPARVQLLTQRY